MLKFKSRRRVRAKIERLHRAGYTLLDLAREAKRSYRMAQIWAAGKDPRSGHRVKSAALEEAYARLLANPVSRAAVAADEARSA